MSKMREAFFNHYGVKWEVSTNRTAKQDFEAGYQAAIADVKVVGEVGSVQGQTAYVFATSDALFKVGDKLYKPEDV